MEDLNVVVHQPVLPAGSFVFEDLLGPTSVVPAGDERDSLEPARVIAPGTGVIAPGLAVLSV